MRILVAGGAGFIGSHLCRRLLALHHDVIVVDDFSTGSRDNVAPLMSDPCFQLIQADVAHAPSLPIDRIIHLASPASPVDYDRMPLHTMAANSLGTWRLVDIAREQNATLLFVSTSEVYGDPLVHPQPEEYWGNVDPVGPRSCYDESKRFGEALVFAARREHGIRANVVRLFNTYGPRMRPDDGRVIPEMISAALAGRPLILHGDGLQTRSFCYVRDLVEGLRWVLLDPEIDGEIFNIGNPTEITMVELARRIVHISGRGSPVRHIPRRPGDPERRKPVISRMTQRYAWRPMIGLEEGLRETFESFAPARTAPAVPLAVQGIGVAPG